MNLYSWLEENFETFLRNIGQDRWIEYADSIVIADGDKTMQYKNQWERRGIHFFHGTMLYLITKMSPYDKEVRNTRKGFVPPAKWVIDNFKRFEKHLPDEHLSHFKRIGD